MKTTNPAPTIDPCERLNGFDDSRVCLPTDSTPTGNVVALLIAVIVGALTGSAITLLIIWRQTGG